MVQFLNLAFVDDLVNSFKLIFDNLFWTIEVVKAALWFLIYGIGSLMLMLLDFVQDCFKKLAGLDTYYYEGVNSEFTHEDILQRLLTTPEILKAFGSLVVVGIILLFLFTIIQFIRVEYTTEGAKNSKGNIIQQSLKAVGMFVIVPVASLIGIFLSNKVLQIIDNATDPSPGSTIAGNIFKISAYDANPIRAGKSTYGGFGLPQQAAIYLQKNPVYEGPELMLSTDNGLVTFKTKDYDGKDPDPKIIYGLANSAKMQITATGGTETSPTGKTTAIYKMYTETRTIHFEGTKKDKNKNKITYTFDYTTINPERICSRFSGLEGNSLAETIDDVMAHRGENKAEISTNTYSGSKLTGNKFTGVGIDKGDSLDYTNVFAVMYFYNMQDINYFMLFVCSGFAIVCLYKAAFGMIMRLYMCAILFIISPPIIAMAPMDNGKALSSWKSKFLGQVIAAYGTVVALNIFFTVMPIIEKIELFRAKDSPWLSVAADFFNGLVQCVFVLVGCFMLKDISKTISGLIGAEDAMASGDGMSKQIGAVATKAASVGVGLAAGGAGMAMKMGSKLAGKIGTSGKKKFDKAGKNLDNAKKDAENDAVAQKLGFKSYGELSDKGDLDAFNDLKANMSDDEKAEIAEAVDNDSRVQNATAAFNKAGDKFYGGKLKSGLRKVSSAGYLMGERFSAAGGSNLTSFTANTAFAKTTKAVFGEATPAFLGGKGSHAFDDKIAGKNDFLAEMIQQEGSAAKDKREEKAVKRMGAVADAVHTQNEVATQEKIGAELVKTLDANGKKAVKEVQDLKDRMLDIMSQMQSGALGMTEGRNQMQAMYNNARSAGILSADSESSIGSMLSQMTAAATPGSSVMLKDVAAELKTSTTFESKMEVAMKDPKVQSELNALKEAVRNKNYTSAADASEKLKKELAKQGVTVDSIQQLMEKMLAEAAKTKAEERDLKKLLAQLGKMTK